MMKKMWWERFPGRLEYELQALRESGIPYQLDEKAKASGSIVLELQPVLDNSPMRLVTTFPDFYPYFRFEVSAPDLDLRHHQNPFGKNLCLIGRNTAHWKTSDTLAAYITERLPQLLQVVTAKDPTTAEALEEHQGEPISTYYPCKPGTILLVDSSWSIPIDVPKGRLALGLSGQHTAHVIRGAILKVSAPDGKVLATADPSINQLYSKQIGARWFRIRKPANEPDPQRFLDEHEKQHPSISKFEHNKLGDWDVDLFGFVFSDELGYREHGDAWIFVVRAVKTKGNRTECVKYFVRPGQAGRSDLSARIPELAIMPQRRIAIIGLGGIGAPAALELAKGGIGELRILDGDIVEPGPSVRWPLGFAYAGYPKAMAIQEFVGTHYPYTNVVPYPHMIGSAFPLSSQHRDHEILDKLLDGVDLVYDATAEFGVQYLLSDLAAEKKIPYICASTTPGAWGGLLVRIRPGKTEGCWSCLQGQLDKSIPSPLQNMSGMVQPKGCADPTFTGTGCDVAHIALAGSRLAISTICSGENGAYPDVSWDIAVCALRDADGQVIVPRWKTFPLLRSTECQRCAQI